MRRTNTSVIVDKLLVLLATTSAAGLSIVAPNSVKALEKPLERFIKNKDRRQEAKRIARYLKQQKLIEVTENDDGTFLVTLSDKGVMRSTKVRFEQLEIPQKQWDKKWRVVTFDIPEQHKTTRDYISRHLRLVGFKQLQKSVFIYPYPVDEFIALLVEMLPEVSPYLTYMLVEEIDQHNSLVKKFSRIL
jgi:phenylacetic acid degradation operon negative regulatory protein